MFRKNARVVTRSGALEDCFLSWWQEPPIRPFSGFSGLLVGIDQTPTIMNIAATSLTTLSSLPITLSFYVRHVMKVEYS